jgi:hypothetical protein
MAVVDPGERPVRTGVGVDPRQLPMGAGLLGEHDVRPAARQVEQPRQVLVRPVLPARAPDALEVRRELGERGRRPSREQMRDAVDQRGDVPGAVERQDAVDVDQEEGAYRS